MNGQAAVTIGVRTYDRNILLPRAIESVLAQTYGDWRLVILNNGGDADSLERTIDPYRSSIGDRLTVRHSAERLTMGAASNAAIDGWEQSRYFAHHDDDDVWHPSFLERTVAALENTNDEVLGVFTQFVRIVERILPDGTTEELSRKHDNPTLISTSFQESFMGNLAPPIATLYKTQALSRVGPFDNSFSNADDWEFQLRVLTKARIAVVAEPLAYRYERSSGDAYANVSSQERVFNLLNAKIRDEFTEQPMREGLIPVTDVSLAISEIDRENHTRINESLDHVRELRLQIGDIDNRTRHVLGLLERYDPALRALRTLLLPVIWLRRLGRRLKRRGG